MKNVILCVLCALVTIISLAGCNQNKTATIPTPETPAIEQETSKDATSTGAEEVDNNIITNPILEIVEPEGRIVVKTVRTQLLDVQIYPGEDGYDKILHVFLKNETAEDYDKKFYRKALKELAGNFDIDIEKCRIDFVIQSYSDADVDC
jgi:hypothetical protein